MKPNDSDICNLSQAAKLGPGVMGVGRVPITRGGQVAYYTKQRLCSYEISVTAKQLGAASDLSDSDLAVEIEESSLAIGIAGRRPYIQGSLWKWADPSASTWHVHNDELQVVVRKRNDSYGSWIHLLQDTGDSFANRQSDCHNRVEFEALGEQRAADRMHKLRAEAAAKSALIQRCLDEPVHKVAFLFPGQGAQSVGMLKQAQHLLPVQKMNAIAYEVLGYDLLDLCMNGSEKTLNQTQYSQPAMLMANLAAVELLLSRGHGSVVKMCSAAAGLSLGEWAALVFAGVMSFDDAMRCIKVRGEMMAAAALVGPQQGMINVVGLEHSQLVNICSAIASESRGTTCQVANHLFPKGFTVSGQKAALAKVQAAAKEQGATRATEIAVTGAFHTPLMSPAMEAIKCAMATISLHEPRIPVISNVTGQPMTTASEVLELLPRQVCEPVLWEQSLRTLVAGSWKRLYELGPGGQLKRICGRVDRDVEAHLIHVAP